jgi:hypothetical protein
VFYKNGELYVGYRSGKPCVKNQKGEQCLDQNVPYVTVPNAQTPPTPTKIQPDVLKELLDVVPATIAPFTGGGGGGGSTGGTVSSFCIQ